MIRGPSLFLSQISENWCRNAGAAVGETITQDWSVRSRHLKVWILASGCLSGNARRRGSFRQTAKAMSFVVRLGLAPINSPSRSPELIKSNWEDGGGSAI